MSTSLLKSWFPQLNNLSDVEIEKTISEGGALMALLLQSHSKRLTTPPGRGRPRKAPKTQVVIPKRGRNGDRISPTSTNIQLAEMAAVYGRTLKLSNTVAARETLKELSLECSPRNVRRLAKQISELPARENDKNVRRRKHMNEKPHAVSDLSVASLLKVYLPK